jgi:hypothetical protein
VLAGKEWSGFSFSFFTPANSYFDVCVREVLMWEILILAWFGDIWWCSWAGRADPPKAHREIYSTHTHIVHIKRTQTTHTHTDTQQHSPSDTDTQFCRVSDEREYQKPFQIIITNLANTCMTAKWHPAVHVMANTHKHKHTQKHTHTQKYIYLTPWHRLTRWIQVKVMIPYWCHLLNPLQSA